MTDRLGRHILGDRERWKLAEERTDPVMSSIVTSFLAAATLFGAATTAVAGGAPRTVEISVTENGFEPTPISVKKGEPLKLVITRKTDKTCAKAVVFDDPKIKKTLPLNEAVEITFTPSKTGELKYGCAMGKMVEGVLKVE
jgi:plastocyanin domain-containing protein